MERGRTSREQNEPKSPVTAASIAARALAETRQPEQERRQTEEKNRQVAEKRRQASVLRAAEKRLAGSPIGEWFPDVAWDFVERSELEKLDVWQSGEEGLYDMVRLGVRADQSVLFVTDKQRGLPPSYPGRPQPETWGGIQVQSAADVGKCIERHREASRVPDWAE